MESILQQQQVQEQSLLKSDGMQMVNYKPTAAALGGLIAEAEEVRHGA